MNKKIIFILVCVPIALTISYFFFKSNKEGASASVSKTIEMISNCETRFISDTHQAGMQIYTKDDKKIDIAVKPGPITPDSDYQKILDAVRSNPGNCEPAPTFVIE